MTDIPPPIRRILVPHDFSETAEKAFGLALALAAKLGASLTLLHVYEVPSYAFAEGVPLPVSLTEEIAAAARSALEVLAGRAAQEGVPIATLLRQGAAWSEIAAAAKEPGADLIVMGTHGRRGVARMLLGSVAEKVVRTAPCPVLTVHGNDAAAAPK
jgi:nucleotide-binding universal stress UspA family protein